MFYVVADEFVQAYGDEYSIHVGFKWRSRREAMDWLTSMLSKQHLPGNQRVTDSPKYDPTLLIGSIECPKNRTGAQQTRIPDDRGCLPRNGYNLDIVWSGIAWNCCKQLRHYPAFSRNGTTIKEWMPASKLAFPDKLGMRCAGRRTIRPALAPTDGTDLALWVGAAVDGWWSDGWWKGVVIGLDSSALQIYSPGESLLLNIHKKDVRISRDWVPNHWIEIESKPDILSVISCVSPETRVAKCDEFDMPHFETRNSMEQNVVEDRSTAQAEEDMEWEDPPSRKDKGSEDDSVIKCSGSNVDVQGNSNDKEVSVKQ